MVLFLLQSPARCFARHQLCCSRTDRCRSHYQATSSHSTGAADPSKPSRKRSQVGVTSAGSALSSLTIQPLQRSSKNSEQPWSSGILCTGENCSYKADSRTVAWLKDLFNGLDSNGDGAITKGDLKSLMRQTNSYLEPIALDWLSEAELGNTFDNYDADHSGDISFYEFEHMVYQEVLDWEPPVAGVRCILEFGETTLISQVPEPSTLPPPAPVEVLDQYSDLPLLPSATNDADMLHGAFHEVDIYTPFSALLHHLWTLWEVLLLAEPLLVLAPSPGECSTAVAALIALISPLPYSADFRPYFTIHDPDFQAMTSPEPAPSSTNLPRLLGVTNRYFLKALPQWPNTVSIGTKPAQAVGAQKLRGSRMGRAVAAVRQRTLGSPPQLGDHVQALWTGYKPVTKPDQQLLDRLIKAAPTDSSMKAARMATLNSQAIRKHFVELTSAMLMPFAPYCHPVGPPAEAASGQLGIAPGQASTSPSSGQSAVAQGQPGAASGQDVAVPGAGAVLGQEPPHLPAFSHAEFIEQLQSSQMPAVLLQRFRTQAACVQFYKRFIECPNFMAWFERRRGAAAAWQEEVWSMGAELQEPFQDSGSEDAGKLEPSLSDVQLVEAFFDVEGRLEAALAAARHPATAPQAALEASAVKQQLSAIFESMPRDLQQTMLSSPHRAALLQGSGPHAKVPGQPQRQRSSSSL